MIQGLLSRLELVHPSGPGRWIARCPAHADRSPSLSIGEGGDGRVLLHCFAGCELSDIARALGLTLANLFQARPGAYQRGPQPPRHPVPRHDDERSEYARRLWTECRSATGSPVQSYLAHRGIVVDPVPLSLRFHPHLHHSTGTYGPAMVAAVQARDGRIVAVHRTWLDQEGTGKANLEPSRKMLGPCAGGAVRFAEPGEHLALCEGIETALSVALACPGLACWAALSTSGLTGIDLPSVVRHVTICADADGAGIKAAREAASRLMLQGRTVEIAVPPREGADFNDLLRESSGAAGCAS